MDDWRLKAGLDPRLVDAVPPILWLSDLAREQIAGNGRRSVEEMRPHLMEIAGHHVELVMAYMNFTGEIPNVIVAIHQEPRYFLPHCLVSIHGGFYSGDRVAIMRDDEVLNDILAGRVNPAMLPPEAVEYLHYRERNRGLLVN